MKYSSFATLAAVFAVITLASSSLTSVAAKTDVAHANSPSVAVANVASKPAPELYAQAAGFNETSLVRLDAQPLAAPSTGNMKAAKPAGEPAPLDLMALVIAGLAVMGSLAFRRAPSK